MILTFIIQLNTEFRIEHPNFNSSIMEKAFHRNVGTKFIFPLNFPWKCLQLIVEMEFAVKIKEYQLVWQENIWDNYFELFFLSIIIKLLVDFTFHMTMFSQYLISAYPVYKSFPTSKRVPETNYITTICIRLQTKHFVKLLMFPLPHIRLSLTSVSFLHKFFV